MSTSKRQLLTVGYIRQTTLVTIPHVITLLIVNYSKNLEAWSQPHALNSSYISTDGQMITQKRQQFETAIYGSFLIKPSNSKKESYHWSLTVSECDTFGFGFVSAKYSRYFWFEHIHTSHSKLHQAEISCIYTTNTFQMTYKCNDKETSLCAPIDTYLLALWMPKPNSSAQITSFDISFDSK